MLAPSKFVSFSESTLSVLAPLLEQLEHPTHLRILYAKTRKRFEGVETFLYALDVLYILGMIDVDLGTGWVQRAD